MGIGKTIGEKLKERGKTAAWLSRETGIPATTIRSAISHDSDKMNLDAIGKIAAALGCKVSELMPFEEYARQKMSELQNELAEYDREYIETLSRPALELNHIGKITLLKAAYSMADDPDYTEPETDRMLEMWGLVDNGREAEEN